jgi:hypothetical protein
MTNRLLVATRKGLATVHRRPTGWEIDEKFAFLGAPVSIALHDPRSDYLYAALHHGHFGCKLHRSRDGGATWDEIPVPAFPPKPDDAPEVLCPMRKTPIPWSVEMLWSLATGAAEGQLWCGTIPGGLFVSRDHGDSWQLVESLWNRPERAKWFGGGYDWPGIHSVCPDPRDPRRLAVAVSCGGVWCSDDDGATWACRADGMRAAYMPPEAAGDPDVQDPHLMVRSPSAPDTLWVQHHNSIFVTRDNCGRWEEVTAAEPYGFGFAVAVHPANPDVAWFAPAIKDELRVPVDGRFIVTRTRDGGRTFEKLSAGLPEGLACHLVYRHGLAVDATGDVLAMASTTGSLWISENGGDSWTRLSAELPPVYAVAFG